MGKLIRIESRAQWEDYKKRLREACAKANAEMSEKDLRKLLEDADKSWRCLMPEEKLPESVEYEDGCTCGKCLPCKVREVMRKAEEAARLDSGRHHGG